MRRREPARHLALERRLLAYSAIAGVASVAGQAQAAGCNAPGVLTGAICYTDPDPDVVIPPGGSFLFDFDHDGDAELYIFVTSSAFAHHAPWAADGVDQVAAVVGSPIAALTSGAVISAGNATGAAAGGLYFWGVETRFGGVRLALSEGSAHFGWLRVTRNVDFAWTVHDYAYKTTPDGSISAGQSTPVELQSFELE